MHQPKVYIVIVTYNGMVWIDSCLKSLRGSTWPLKTIVVDNCSKDETVNFISNNYQEVILIPLKANVGFGQANNKGIQQAYDDGADFVYLLNQDAWLMPDTIERLVEVMSGDKEIGIASPMQLDATQKRVDMLFLKDILLSEKAAQELLDGFITGELKKTYYLWYFPAAHWMISRRCIEDVGLFSPAFFHYGEDNNYIQRAHYHGLKTSVVPNAKAVHDRGERGKINYLGLAFLQYNKAIIQVSNIEVGPIKHLLYQIKYYIITVVYFVITRFIFFLKEKKMYYVKMTPIGVVNRCYRQSKKKGFMLN